MCHKELRIKEGPNSKSSVRKDMRVQVPPPVLQVGKGLTVISVGPFSLSKTESATTSATFSFRGLMLLLVDLPPRPPPGKPSGHPLHAPADGPPIAAREQFHARRRLEAIVRRDPAHGATPLLGRQQAGIDRQELLPRLRMGPPDAIGTDRAQATGLRIPKFPEDRHPILFHTSRWRCGSR